jgi:uncharacterized protein YceK
MKNINLKSHSFSIIMITCAIIPFLLAGCQSVNSEQPSTQEHQETIIEVEMVEGQDLLDSYEPTISVDMGSIANDMQNEIIPAVSPDSNSPYWEILPQHQVFSLEGYEISEHLMKAQIFLYPVAELDLYNAGASKAAADLKKLLEDKEVGEYLPFLPLFNAAQVMHAKVEFIDFGNGKGVRYLTQFDQAPIPINNYELIYTYQGLSEDGKYYVAAIFPVTHPELPESNDVAGDQEFIVDNFIADMAESVVKLENLSDSSFSPDLTKLDALIQSIEIN